MQHRVVQTFRLSVAIAFVFGTVVQFLSRLIFSFNYRSRLRWKIGIFGGVCTTAIVYFLLIKGASGLSFMTADVKAWIASHTALIIACSFVGFTVIMQTLHALGVNVLKVIVLLGTFSLAMAFAGNDLVNFIGVPLTGFAILCFWNGFSGSLLYAYITYVGLSMCYTLVNVDRPTYVM